MKINQIIREKRKELSLTQEQVADYLGVTAPAVNKWEKGSTYPDITLLPALARLLKTDLNTLMSFREDLTEVEINSFIVELEKMMEEQGYEAAFQAAIDKLHEYPACEKLMYYTIFNLDGALAFYDVPGKEHYKEIFETYYERMAKSETAEIREMATTMLISINRNRGNFAKAEELIDSLPTCSIDKEEHLAVLYTQQEKYAEAERIWEHRILKSVAEVQTALLYMMEIAVKESRDDDAVLYAELYEATANQFKLCKWTAYVAKLELAVTKQDEDKCITILQKILPAMKEKWNPSDCPLYRNLGGNDTSALSKKVEDALKNDLKTGGTFSFLRKNEEFRRMMKEIEG